MRSWNLGSDLVLSHRYRCHIITQPYLWSFSDWAWLLSSFSFSLFPSIGCILVPCHCCIWLANLGSVELPYSKSHSSAMTLTFVLNWIDQNQHSAEPNVPNVLDLLDTDETCLFSDCFSFLCNTALTHFASYTCYRNKTNTWQWNIIMWKRSVYALFNISLVKAKEKAYIRRFKPCFLKILWIQTKMKSVCLLKWPHIFRILGIKLELFIDVLKHYS